MQTIPQNFMPQDEILKKSSLIESLFVIGIFFGIMLMGSKFTHVGFERLYIVEYALILLNAVLAIKVIQDASIRRHIFQLASRELICLTGLLVVGITTLLICMDNGFLAMRQSLITLYASAVFIYIYSFNSEKSLLTFLCFLLIFFSIFNCIKIFTYLYLGLTHEDEPYRVKHEEVDAIFSAIALLALLSFRKTFFNNRRYLFIGLTLLNLVVLFLTIKRTAFIGLFIGSAFIIYQDNIYKILRKKHLFIVAIAFFCLSVLSTLFFREQIYNASQILVKKINVLSENNSVWRIEAWKIAVNDIVNSPIWGNGYGHRILKESLKGVDTMDPHNSYLAIAAYNGLLGLFLLVATLIVSAKKYLALLNSSTTPDQRNTVLFFAAGLIFMVIYAFFNVTLEVQRLAIFYWFFVAGSFLLARLRSTPSSVWATTSVKSMNLRGIFLFAGLFIYLVSLGLSANYIKRIDIYLPANQGQYPKVKSPGENSATIAKEKSHFTLTISPQETSAYTELQWIIPNDIYVIKGRENKYYAVFEIEGETKEISAQFRTFNDNPIDAENLFPNSNKIVIPLASLANRDLKTIYGIALIIPHSSKAKTLTFRRVAIEAMELQNEYAIFSEGGINQTPTLQATGPAPQLDITNKNISVQIPGSEGIAYANLNWQLPLFLNNEYLGKNRFLEFIFNAPMEAQNSFVQFSNRDSHTTLENITPNSKKITLDLAQIDPAFMKDKSLTNTLSLHIKNGDDIRHIQINSVKFLAIEHFFSKITIFSSVNHGDLYPQFYTENNAAAFAKEITDDTLVIQSKKHSPGWSSIYWPIPKINLSARDLNSYALIVDFGNTTETSLLKFGFTINGQYIAVDDYKFVAEGKLQISTQAVQEKLYQSSLINKEVGLNISPPTEPHEMNLTIKEIYLIKKGE